MADRRNSGGRRQADSARLHWMKFYLDDWATSLKVRMMGPIARAWYWELLILQWREGYVPDSDQYLMRYLSQMPRDPSTLTNPQEDNENDYPAILKQVKECFRELNPGKLVNEKLHVIRTQTLAEFEAKSLGAQRANAKRWDTKSVSSPDSDTDIDTERTKTTAPPAVSRKGTRLPENFEVTDEHREFARKHGLLKPEAVIDEFRDYWRAVPGQRGCKLDWDATFRNRLREITGRRSNGNGRQSAFERVADEVRETD